MSFFTLPDSTNPFIILWWVFSHGGFIPVLIAIGYGIWWVYLDYIQGEYIKNTKYVYLAVDVPRENEQTPKAVEHIFSHFQGIAKGGNLIDKYVNGVVQPTISTEIISINGYIQYVMRVPAANRDMVESAIYAQYPNAEITEVEDYTQDFQPVFPNPEYQMWGAEIVLAQDNAYPIKTYPVWEDKMTESFLDPLASLLEVMNRLKDGEQIWIQLVLSPAGNAEFRKAGLETINKLIGAKSKAKVSTLDSLANIPGSLVQGTAETVLKTLWSPDAVAPKKENKKDDAPNQLSYLPPHMRAVVEAIGEKIAKLAFTTKFRIVYVAKKEAFNGARIGAVLGALKQFGTLDMNSFRPSGTMKTGADYFFVEQRTDALRRKILRHFKQRSMAGGKPIMLNTEELASLWHFPVSTVKAPSIQKTDAKRGEPPVRLPIGEETEYVPPAPEPEFIPPTPGNTPPAGGPPTNLPIS
jgi:hypothetical protein